MSSNRRKTGVEAGRLDLFPSPWDIWRAGRGDGAAVVRRQRSRLAVMSGFARRHSAFYREQYRQVPDADPDILSLPPVTKQQLMESFSDWVTDPAVTREGGGAFVSATDRAGTRDLGRRGVFATAGTTGA